MNLGAGIKIVKQIADSEGVEVLPICAGMEQEIAEFPDDEKMMFLYNILGILAYLPP